MPRPGDADGEVREARDRRRRLKDAIDAANVEAPHAPRRYLGRVIANPRPGASTPYYVDTHPVTISGPEAAGGAATRTVDATRTVPVLVLGGIVVAGADLVAKTVRGRWVAYLPGGPGIGQTITVVDIPHCFCQDIPGTLEMVSSDESCNFRMFQSCTIQWQPVPTEYGPLFLGSDAFLSIESFPDILAGGALFRYLLTCAFNEFDLTRIYATSPYGSPFRDGVLYSWFVGGTCDAGTNTCVPFRLYCGEAFPGSDLSCNVTIIAP